MRIKVDREVCQGNARCFALAPEVYTLDDEGAGLAAAAVVGAAG